MRNILLILFIATFTFKGIEQSYSQPYTTTSKNCGKCGKSVSPYSRVGHKCPHCGAFWGKENTYNSSSNSGTSTHSNYIYESPTKNEISKNTIKEGNEIDNSNVPKVVTEKWILGKLRAYTPKKYLYYRKSEFNSNLGFTMPEIRHYYMNYQYSFDSHNLIIEYEEDWESRTVKYKVVIPIYDIVRVYDRRGELWITTNKNTITKYDKTRNTKRVTSVFSTEFDYDAETDLSERLHKAFLHLKKFYKKPISTEPF